MNLKFALVGLEMIASENFTSKVSFSRLFMMLILNPFQMALYCIIS